MSNPTYNVDAAFLKDKWRNLVFQADDANTNLTDTVVTSLVTSAAARLNGVLGARFPGHDLTTITEAAQPVAYHNARRIVRALLGPALLTAAHHTLGLEAARMEAEAAADELRQISKDPTIFGLPLGTKKTPRGSTHLIGMGLDTDDESRRKRRRWDDDGKTKMRW